MGQVARKEKKKKNQQTQLAEITSAATYKNKQEENIKQALE